jgi:hypothetical protein
MLEVMDTEMAKSGFCQNLEPYPLTKVLMIEGGAYLAGEDPETDVFLS